MSEGQGARMWLKRKSRQREIDKAVESVIAFSTAAIGAFKSLAENTAKTVEKLEKFLKEYDGK